MLAIVPATTGDFYSFLIKWPGVITGKTLFLERW